MTASRKSGRQAINPFHQKVYNFFGSQEKLAKILNLNRQNFYHWGRNGIPHKHAYEIEKLSKGVFTVDKLLKNW